MINDTLKQIEEEWQHIIPAVLFEGEQAIIQKEKEHIIKVLQQLVERESVTKIKRKFKPITEKYKNAEDRKWAYNKAKQNTISYLKSEIAKLSTNIDKE